MYSVYSWRPKMTKTHFYTTEIQQKYLLPGKISSVTVRAYMPVQDTLNTVYTCRGKM